MKNDLVTLLELVAIGGALALGAPGCAGDQAEPTDDSGATAGCPTAACPTAACPTATCPTATCPTATCPTASCPTASCPTASCPTASCPTAGDAQTPPQGDAAMTAWIAGGAYLAWACEADPHPPRSPSPHGPNRICSNDLMSNHGAGEYPVGSASVKELYDNTGANIVGYAVSLHPVAGTTGADWYWYETTDAAGLIADGLGDAGTPLTVCVGCHAGAGSDADHSGHDFVYTQVP
ncbi:MAG: hypothetical protein ABMB14_28465 [Myxococcota bacterium]